MVVVAFRRFMGRSMVVVSAKLMMIIVVLLLGIVVA
jgi:hypothetical protein